MTPPEKRSFARREGEYWSFRPIGVVRSPYHEKMEAPRQPAAARGVEGRIELFAGHGFEHALEDVIGWEHLWVVFVFDRNEHWRPKVLPPRSDGRRHGVFSTRSPHRPNPIGLSAVRLVAVDGLVLRVTDLDVLDGSPVLDIKPYVPYTDALPTSRSGWLEAPNAASDPKASFRVSWEEEARAQAEWLLLRGVDLREPSSRLLALGPEPHPYRRIRKEGVGFRLAHKEWRVWFVSEGDVVRVLRIGTGYRPSQLAGDEAELAIHREFFERFGAPKAPW